MLVAQRASSKQADSNRIDCHRSKRMICNLLGERIRAGHTDKDDGAKNTRYTHLTQARSGPGAPIAYPGSFPPRLLMVYTLCLFIPSRNGIYRTYGTCKSNKSYS